MFRPTHIARQPAVRQASVLQPPTLRVPQPPRESVERPLPRQISHMPRVQENLEVIHHRSRLVIAHNNITRTAIADPSVIDVVQYSPNEISIIGLTLGSTTLTLWFENSNEPLIYLVKTIRDPSLDEQRRVDYGKLEQKLALLFPNSKVFLIPMSRKIIVKGQARDAEEAARILQIIRGEIINQEGGLFGPQPDAGTTGGIDPVAATYGVGTGNRVGNGSGIDGFYSSYIVNMLEVPGEAQIMLRVRIAELNRSQLRRMGIDFNYLFNGGKHAVGYALGGLPSTLTGVFENNEIRVLVNLLASNGTAKILSEPVLTVLSGHAASFLSGGEFAVPTIIGISGAQGQTTTFRGFGTSLIVTPTVIDKDLIRMRIVPEFSQLNQGNAVNGIPGLDSRRVQTTVELREGQTIAIAGLLAHQSNTEVTRIPFLGEIPYFGAKLFNSKLATQDETELLILVTPELVRPMDADEVPPVPGHEVTHPNDFELYHAAMTEGAPDTGVYQIPPYGRGTGYGHNVGYRLFEPAPATPGYSPAVTAPYGDPALRNQQMMEPAESSSHHQTQPSPMTPQMPVNEPTGSLPPPPQQGRNNPTIPPQPDPAATRFSPPPNQTAWPQEARRSKSISGWTRRLFKRNNQVQPAGYLRPYLRNDSRVIPRERGRP